MTAATGCYVAETFINQIRFGGLPEATENKTTIAVVNSFSIDFLPKEFLGMRRRRFHATS